MIFKIRFVSSYNFLLRNELLHIWKESDEKNNEQYTNLGD